MWYSGLIIISSPPKNLVEMLFFGVHIFLSVNEFVEGKALVTPSPLVHHAGVDLLPRLAYRALQVVDGAEGVVVVVGEWVSECACVFEGVKVSVVVLGKNESLLPRACVYACTRVYLCVCVHIYVHMCVFPHVCMYVSIHLWCTRYVHEISVSDSIELIYVRQIDRLELWHNAYAHV